jgi:Xaa-Pro aminopeptidase
MSEAIFDTQEFTQRHARVRDKMREEGLDAIIAYSNSKVKGPVRYLGNYYTRFTGAQNTRDGRYFQFGSCAALFPRDGEPRLVTDQPWDVERARELSIFANTGYSENFGLDLGTAVAADGYHRIGIDNWFIFPAPHYLGLRERAPDAELVPTMLIEDVYRVKSARELELMRNAEQAAVRGVEAGRAAVDVGVSEYDFALAADYAIRNHGDLETAGNAIIAGGPNTATGSGLPRRADAHVMRPGDWAMFDLCPAYEGYAGDICRMVVAGRVDDLDSRLKAMYELNREINERVIEAVRPGVTPAQLNALAVDIADRTDYGKYKIELLGHSLGPDMHDPPDYYYDNQPLEENMTITIEPCFLMPGVGGCRVEDVVVVAPGGCEVLSADSPKELRGSAD